MKKSAKNVKQCNRLSAEKKSLRTKSRTLEKPHFSITKISSKRTVHWKLMNKKTIDFVQSLLHHSKIRFLLENGEVLGHNEHKVNQLLTKIQAQILEKLQATIAPVTKCDYSKVELDLKSANEWLKKTEEKYACMKKNNGKQMVEESIEF